MVIVVNKIKEILKKIINIVKKNKYFFITFIVSSICVSVIYTFEHIKPFGNNSMLDVDFYHQYGPLLNELYDRIRSGESLLYSFNTGGGIPFYRNLLNYLSSPFNIILFLFKKENIIMAFSIIIGLKAILASCTMSLYLKRILKNDSVYITIFSLFYAFSGYFCAYYWNIMWLDGIVFFPLILLGINKLVDDNKPLLYTFSLAVMLLANYFIGYMVCISCAFYFLIYLIHRYRFKIKILLKKCLMFGLFSLLAGGLVAFLLIPLYKSLSSISATSDVFPSLPSFNFNPINYIFNHITGVNRTVFASEPLPLPNVYPGLLSLVGIILFFFNKNIHNKAKIIALCTILFFFLSFNVNVLDFIWHAFHVPNDLPYRYSFIYVFVLVILGCYGLYKSKECGTIIKSIGFSIILFLILLAFKFNFKNINDTKVIICIVLLLCYYLVLMVKKIPTKVTNILLIFIASTEAIFGISSNWEINHDIDTFMSDKSGYQELISIAKKEDNGLYRVEKTSNLTLNDPAWYDYYGISTFSSMAYENVSKAQRKLGLSGNNINSYYYQKYSTPIYNSMFNIKYLLGDYILNSYYTHIDSIDENNLVRYDYSTSLVYLVNNDIKNLNLIEYEPFYNQQEFVKYSTGLEGIYNDLQVKRLENATVQDENFYNKSNGEYYYETVGDKIIYYIDNPKSQNIYVYVNSSNIESFYADGKYYSINSDEYYIVDIGRLNKGEVKIELNLKEQSNCYVKFYAYSIEDEIFKRFYSKIKDECLNVKSYTDTSIIGTINASSNKTAFTSIAYDEGWNVYIDDKKVDTYILMDSYLGFDVPAGEHEISLEYVPSGLKIGVIISCISAVSIGIYIIILRKKEKLTKKIK